MNDKNDKDYDDIENNKNNAFEKHDWNNKMKHKHKNRNNNKCNDSFSVTKLILFYNDWNDINDGIILIMTT